MTRLSASRRLATLAEDQWGLFTRRQAENQGLSRSTLHRLDHESGLIERMGPGVFHLAGAPLADHVPLRAAWMQLAPETLGWERKPEQGVISHRSAAALYGLGHLPADRHEFITPTRRQSRRPDVRIRQAQLRDDEWTRLHGLFVTTPARTAADLLAAREEPAAVAEIVADALRREHEQPEHFAAAFTPRAVQLGLRRGDGVAALAHLLNLVEDPRAPEWLQQAANSTEGSR